jgi:starch synthase (maltosyl-transferring)
MAERNSQGHPRIYYLHHRVIGPAGRLPEILDHAADLGFTHVLLSPPYQSGRLGDVFFPVDHDAAHAGLETELTASELIADVARATKARGMALLLDLAPQQFALEHPFVEESPDSFTVRREVAGGPVDPRMPGSAQGSAWSRLDPKSTKLLQDFWAPRLAGYLAGGVAGFRAVRPTQASAGLWRELIAQARKSAPECLFIADTTGLPRSDALALEGCGFSYILSSLPWWDFQSSWLVEEYEALSAIAPVMAMPEAPFSTRLAERVRDSRGLREAYTRALSAAAALGCGMLVPVGFEHISRRPLDASQSAPEDYDRAVSEAPFAFGDVVRRVNAMLVESKSLRRPGRLRPLTGPSAKVTGILRTPADPRISDEALLLLVNPDLIEPRDVSSAKLRPQMGGEFGAFTEFVGGEGTRIEQDVITLAPGEALIARADRAKPVKLPRSTGKRAPKAAGASPRIIVDGVAPSVDEGRYPVKAIVGDALVVEADALMDGHEVLGVELQWRARDEETWKRMRMAPLGNDRFRGTLHLERLGRHEFVIEAWFDRYGSFARDLRKKDDAKVDTALDLIEGRTMIEEAQKRVGGDLKRKLAAVLSAFDKAEGDAMVEVLLGPETRALMDEADSRPFSAKSIVQSVDAERQQALFASWYELFPRSVTDDPNRHGTLLDVIKELPRVRDMGFDVLYFTPIHPIGKKNRKGRNNTLTPGPEDVGSPYAIGSTDGGHDALHPELGTIEDFRTLRAAAMDHGLELALDFAIQCSPDHPWLKEHPGWFDYRPDGTIKYAENPPKKYEDIVNVDFYAEDAVPGLWIALRDVILFWVKEGVKTFRVDNPHTKPLPFWEWMIGEVRGQHPDVIFLSEAFTRPKMMYHLAKVGFSQSYTYFTWRDSKAELQEYLEELAGEAPKDFYRPHFFVNTPDINPHYLQRSGRAGFLVRACLAATLSGLWGVYSGYELLESEPVPGKEEYKDSEKYEIRVRDWNAPGNIVPDIARLNRIRKANPALHTHTNVKFYNAFNDNIIYYGKPSREGDEMILVAVNLNPHAVEEADIEVPLWEFGLPDHGAVDVDDLIAERAFTWHGKGQHVRLDPAQYPFAIWRIRPHRRS